MEETDIIIYGSIKRANNIFPSNSFKNNLLKKILKKLFKN